MGSSAQHHLDAVFCCWFVHRPLIPHSRHVSSVIVCDSTSLLSCRCCIFAPVLWSGDGESITSTEVSVAPHKILRGSVCIRKEPRNLSPSFYLQCNSCPHDVLWDCLSEVPPYHTNKCRQWLRNLVKVIWPLTDEKLRPEEAE